MTKQPPRTAKNVLQALHALGDPQRAKISQSFFKTGPGEYSEGDLFLGIRVPDLRALTKRYAELSLDQIVALLRSKPHEARLIALLMLVSRFRYADAAMQQKIYSIYLANTDKINNWDLVDLSAEHIVGAWLHSRPKKPIYTLARSSSLWERRIAILSTFHGIKKGDPTETLVVAKTLLHDTHDLIHKAVGWMLREVGKRCSLEQEKSFLRAHAATMPRTMLRYAIEKFPETERKRWLYETKIPS